MTQRPVFQLADATEILARTPQVLEALLRDIDGAWTDCRERRDAWTPGEILAHLIHGEDEDWIPRARWILDEKTGPFPVFDRDLPMREATGATAADRLQEFRRKREDNLNTLRAWNLTTTDLERTGRHPALGTVTLRQLLATWVAHDLSHLRQIARTMASRYREACGPWNHPDYLSIFQGP